MENPNLTQLEPGTDLAALNASLERLNQHKQLLTNLFEGNRELLSHVRTLAQRLEQLSAASAPQPSPAIASAPPTSLPCSTHEAPIVHPEPFRCELDRCRGFLYQCQLFFNRRPQSFQQDSAKISYVLSLLRDRALTWAEAAQIDPASYSFEHFLSRFHAVFGRTDYAGDASTRLLNLHQGNRTVAEFSVHFSTLAVEAGWDEVALRGVYRRALSDQMKNELASRDEPTTLQELMDLAVRIDNRLRERPRVQEPPFTMHHDNATSRGFPANSPSSLPPVEPMQIGRYHLSPEELPACLPACTHNGSLASLSLAQTYVNEACNNISTYFLQAIKADTSSNQVDKHHNGSKTVKQEIHSTGSLSTFASTPRWGLRATYIYVIFLNTMSN